MVDTANFNARELMEKAVDVMRRSVAERRADGKSSPLVGAVLWEPEGDTETAYRGEFRDGDHAEYTLLERKKQAVKLDKAVLFVTLEPCAPGARQPPKLSCAQRIVLARIKEVWVGIEDPDPTVDRRGIRYLQENGVAVRMFDLDLQREIREANKPFLEQALTRAQAEEELAETPSLSDLEDAIPSVDLGDLSSEALDRYRETANIDDPPESAAFLRRLLQLGLLEEGADGRAVPTGFGLLLFGREPRSSLPQAGLLATIQLEDGREEVRDFDGPQVFAPEQALQWLRDRLPNPIDRSDARRVEVNKRLWEMVREAVVNALIHRDYAIKGRQVPIDCHRRHDQRHEPRRTRRAHHVGTDAFVQRADAESQSRSPLRLLAHGIGGRARIGAQVPARGRGVRRVTSAAVQVGAAVRVADNLPERRGIGFGVGGFRSVGASHRR